MTDSTRSANLRALLLPGPPIPRGSGGILGAIEYAATVEQVRRDWREPHEVSAREDGTERWTYYGTLCWNGLLLFAVVIPIPLLVPVGHERVSVDFRNGTAVFGEAIASEELWQAFLGIHLHDGWAAQAGSRQWSQIPETRLSRASGSAAKMRPPRPPGPPHFRFLGWYR